MPGDLVAGEAGGVEVGDGGARGLPRGEVAEAAQVADAALDGRDV